MVLGMPRHGTPHRLKCTPYSTKQGVLTKPILSLPLPRFASSP